MDHSSDMPSQAGSRQGFAMPHLGDIGLVGVLAVLRGGTNIYKYTTAGGGHRRHSRHFQIKGAEEDEAIAWRNASWISIRKERSVLLRNILSVHYGHGELAFLGEAHPGSTMVDADRCFSVKYLDCPSDSQSGSVRYLHLCAQTSGDFSTWRRGLQALLAQREQQPDHYTSSSSARPTGRDSTNTSDASSNMSNILSHGYSEKSQMSSAAESHTTASTVPNKEAGGGAGGRQADEDTHDKRVKLMHHAYDASPRVQSSVVKMQALVRGAKTRAASSKDVTPDLDGAWNSLALQHDDTGEGDLYENDAASPRRHDMASPRTSELGLRHALLDLENGPEDAQSGTVIRQMQQARCDARHVENWAPDAERHLQRLTERLLALLEAQDAEGSGSENEALMQLSGMLDQVTRDLHHTAEQLEQVCGVDQLGRRVALAQTGGVTLHDCHQDSEASERKLNEYELHLTRVLEPALARIGKDIERIKVRTTENCEELKKFEREVASRPAPASARIHCCAQLVRALPFLVAIAAAILLACYRPALPPLPGALSSAASSAAPSLEAAAPPAAASSAARVAPPDARLGASPTCHAQAQVAAGAPGGVGGARGRGTLLEHHSGNAGAVATAPGGGLEIEGEGEAMGARGALGIGAEGQVFGAAQGVSEGGEHNALMRARARAALERQRMQALRASAAERQAAQREHERSNFAVLYPDLSVGGLYAETLSTLIRKLQASLLPRTEEADVPN